MKATISLAFQSKKDAERVLSAINPDNTPLPKGLEIECIVKDALLFISIRCDKSVNTFGSTIEDILSAIDLSIRTADSFQESE